MLLWSLIAIKSYLWPKRLGLQKHGLPAWKAQILPFHKAICHRKRYSTYGGGFPYRINNAKRKAGAKESWTMRTSMFWPGDPSTSICKEGSSMICETQSWLHLTLQRPVDFRAKVRNRVHPMKSVIGASLTTYRFFNSHHSFKASNSRSNTRIAPSSTT